jgi:hypothetical protein
MPDTGIGVGTGWRTRLVTAASFMKGFERGQPMDKREERKALDAVFGKWSLAVEEGERPDFVCSRNEKTLFGVEVTEFFWTESDARLRKIQNYGSDLIRGGDYRHKDDINEIVVSDVMYHVKDTGQSFPIKAIGRMVPLHQSSIPKLLSAIGEKNSKVAEYSKTVNPIDLIVKDVDRVLRFDAIHKILKPIILGSDFATVASSPFREIYLITEGPEYRPVYVPLRANLLASEAAIFSIEFRAFHEEVHTTPTVGDYLTGLSAYLVTRLPEIRYFTDDSIFRFVCGSIAWGLTPDQQINMLDITCEDAADYAKLAPDIDGESIPERLLQMIEERRAAEFVGYEFYFPVTVSTCPD